jgi:hypothetical protein
MSPPPLTTVLLPAGVRGDVEDAIAHGRVLELARVPGVDDERPVLMV